MLMLTRFPNEKILLTLEDGRIITLTYTEMRGHRGQIRLGIDAPKSIKIIRPDAIKGEPKPCV